MSNRHIYYPTVARPAPWADFERVSKGTIVTPNESEGDLYYEDTGFKKISYNILEIHETQKPQAPKYYMASRIPESEFSGHIAVSSGGKGGKTVTITNQYNSNLTENTVTDADGNFTARKVILGDPYKVTVSGYSKTFTPWVNGDTLGCLNVGTGGSVQCVLNPEEATDRFLLYSGTEYRFTLEVTNPGKADCIAPSYILEYDRSKLEISIVPSLPNLSTLEPGTKRTLTVTIKAQVEEVMEILPLTIRFTESITGKIWENDFLFRFNREPLYVAMSTANYDKDASLVIRDPNGLAFYANKAAIPWSDGEYLMAVSHGGPKDGNSGGFLVRFAKNAYPSLSYPGLDLVEDTEAVQPMNTEDTAGEISGQEEILGYLHGGDIDFYKVHLKNPNEGPL
jgi:hypothetical protein